MIDIQFLRKNLSTAVERLKSRHYEFRDDFFKELEDERKTLQTKTQYLQSQKNNKSKEIGIAKAKGDESLVREIMAEVADFDEQLRSGDVQLTAIQESLQELLLQVPNIPDPSVPIGESDSDNVEVRSWGVPRKFDFEERDHVDIGAALGGLEFEIASKISGTRFYTLRGAIARLHRALAQFMLDTHTTEHGYVECYVPYIVNRMALTGTGQLPKFESDLFRLAGKPIYTQADHQRADQAMSLPGGVTTAVGEHQMYLIPTSEVPLTNFVRDEIIRSEKLPLKFTAHTPCFRSEAGSYGKDTRGLIRVHQFDKVEMVQVVHPAKSYDALEEMTAHAENILQKLNLPYRVVLLCTGDMGFAAAKTYDLEVWLPGQGKYREISSCSNCETFQARRMQARFRNAQGKPELVHTLNGSGLAVGRTLVAVLENYQRADGGVDIPAALRSYMGGASTIAATR
jgi:seryl-tRNA synthetase